MAAPSTPRNRVCETGYSLRVKKGGKMERTWVSPPRVQHDSVNLFAQSGNSLDVDVFAVEVGFIAR